MSYPHHLLCTREGTGAQDPDTGAWTPGAPTTVYDGAVDVQDEGETIQRDSEGRPTQVSGGTAYLEDESAIGDFAIGDRVTVTWEDGTTADAVVQKIVRMDGKLQLGWL
jgi:hypothetical protein